MSILKKMKQDRNGISVAPAVFMYFIFFIGLAWQWFYRHMPLGEIDASGWFLCYHTKGKLVAYLWVKAFTDELCLIAAGHFSWSVIKAFEKHLSANNVSDMRGVEFIKTLCFVAIVAYWVDLFAWIINYKTVNMWWLYLGIELLLNLTRKYYRYRRTINAQL